MRVTRHAAACAAALAFTPFAAAQKVVLWENGDPDGVGAHSHIDGDGACYPIGVERSLLDDFQVADPGWSLSCFEYHSVWDTLPPGSGTGFTLGIRDDVGGAPDTANVTSLNVTAYTETATGSVYFSRPEYLGLVTFDPCPLGPDTYWFEGKVCGPGNCFWLIRVTVKLSESWVNYSDLGGFQPGSAIFGVGADLAWSLEGQVLAGITPYCDPSDGHPNNVATISVSGNVLSQPPIAVVLGGGPASQFAYLLIGGSHGVVSQPPGAKGDLCVSGGGAIGRYVKDAGVIGATGSFSTDISSSSSGGPGYGIPDPPGGNIQPGDTWYFQYWHRQPMGQPSTFSQAVAVTFHA